MNAISSNCLPQSPLNAENRSATIDAVLIFVERLFGELETLLQQIEDADYWVPSEPPNDPTIGAHVRHSLEHFVCLLRGIPERMIDYDQRERRVDWERSRSRALLAVAELRAGLRHAFDAVLFDEPVKVRGCLSPGPEGRFELASNAGRELHYSAVHCLHHMAVIGLLARRRGICVDDRFGKAPATLLHESCAR